MSRVSGGFTLVELVITVSLVAILLALGVPSMRNLIQSNLQATQINDIVVSLSLARGESVRRGTGTTMCITDGAATPNCNSGSSQWEDGWIVFVDVDADSVLDAGEDRLLHTHLPLEPGTRLTGNSNVVRDINYDPRGFSGSTGTLTLCDSRGATEARGIVISNTGRHRLAIDSDGDGTVEDGSGRNLTCP